MTRVVANLLRGFGPSGGSAPASPTLAVSDNGDGTATATITGSSATATNTVYYQQAGAAGWTSGGSRIGNGTVTLSLSNGRYFGYVSSLLDGSTAVSNVVTFIVRNGSLSNYQLVHSPSQIVSQLMIELALGSSVTDGVPDGDWPVYFASEPTEPDNVVTVYDNPSELHGVTNTDNEVQRHFGLQIRVRGTAHSVAWTRINLIEIFMNEFVHAETVIIDAKQYLVESFLTRSDIVSLGKEMPGQGSAGMIASGRSILVLNAVVSLRRLN